MARQLTFEIAVEKSRAQQDLRDLEQGMKNLESAATKAGGATDKQKDAYDNLAKRAAAAKDQIKAMGTETDKTTKAQDASAKSTGFATSAILKYVSAGAIIAAIKATADWADRFEELSQSTGLSITMLQKLDVVTRQNGTSIETLSRAFATMQDRVAGGDKSAVKAFERLGFTFDEFKRMRPDDQMENLAIAVMKIENPMERANVVTDLFGRTGVQLIPTLERIAGGMDDITTAAENNIRAMGKLSDWFQALKSTGARLLVDLLGPLITAAQTLTDATSGLVDRFGAFLKLIAVSLPGPLQWLVNKMSELAAVMPGVSNLPKVPGAPGVFGPPEAGGVPAFDPTEITRIEKDINAEIAKQVSSRKSATQEARELRDVLKSQAAEMERMTFFSNQLVSAATLLGVKTKNFGWEDYNPLPPAPGVPGSGTNNAQNILAPYFGNVANPSAPPKYVPNWMKDYAAQQAGFRQQNFGSADGWANSAYSWGSELQDISENGDPLVNATNVRGRGKRAVAGALKGAELGGKFGGPYGAAGGALVGLLVGAFRNPAFEDVWNRIAKNFGTEVSDELAKRIADRAKAEFGNDRQAAEIRSLGDILGESGGLTGDNIGKMTDRLRDAFSMFQGGKFDKKQLQATLNESFGYFADYYDKIGGLADETFTDIVRLARESGVESAAVQKYLSEQVDSATAGIEQYFANATVKSDQAAQGLAASLILLFDETRKGPEGLRGAIEKIGPMMLSLQEQMTAAGYAGSEAFAGALSYVKAFEVEGVEAATTAVDGLNATLTGLANATLLNADAYTGLSRAMVDEINAAREALIAQGQDGDNALRLNADGLQTVWELQQRFGWAVDETTQNMLDQALAQGLIGEKFKDTNEQMLDALNRVADTLQTIADGFGFVGDAAEQAGAVIDDEMGRTRYVPVEYEFPDGGPRGPDGNPDGYANGGVVRGRMGYYANGFVPMGTDTVPAMLTPGEGVLSRRGMRALSRLNEGGGTSGGSTINVTVNGVVGNAREVAAAISEEVVNQMKRRGVPLRGVA